MVVMVVMANGGKLGGGDQTLLYIFTNVPDVPDNPYV